MENIVWDKTGQNVEWLDTNDPTDVFGEWPSGLWPGTLSAYETIDPLIKILILFI